MLYFPLKDDIRACLVKNLSAKNLTATQRSDIIETVAEYFQNTMRRSGEIKAAVCFAIFDINFSFSESEVDAVIANISETILGCARQENW